MRAPRFPRSSAILLGVVLAGLSVGTACDSNPVLPDIRRPFVYLVLNQTVERDGGAVQPAFLLTILRADSVVHRGAERFEMRRLSDGARFDWGTERTDVPLAFGSAAPGLRTANWLLADSATSAGLGRPSLEPGQTYELVIETGGEVIRGRATIPDTFSVSVVEREGRRLAVWPTVKGAAAYSVDAVGAGESFHTPQTDTTYVLADSATALSVIAVGPNTHRFITDENARRAGVEGGLGVFGAILEARWEP